MNAVGQKRLLKLADFLDEMPREKFDFSQIAEQRGKPMMEALRAGRTRCGTVGCAIGWMPAAFPRQLKWDTTNKPAFPDVVLRDAPSATDFDAAERFFGISHHEALWLFHPYWFDFARDAENGLGDDATPKQVARHIRKFVREQLRDAKRSASND